MQDCRGGLAHKGARMQLRSVLERIHRRRGGCFVDGIRQKDTI